jgi:hypothetical protein
MEVTTITEEPAITPNQFRAFYRAVYLQRKNEDVDQFKKLKKEYNAKAYAKRSTEQKQLAYQRKLAKQRELKEETPLI